MKIVSVKQNSKDWTEWRGRGLGASDAPAVMGESPWTSILSLWLDKTGIYPKEPANAFALSAMRRGTELEPKARLMFEDYWKSKWPAISAEHDEFPFIRASFDGWNETLQEGLEIKCPGKVDHATALSGKVPNKYKAQLQQQMFVSGATAWHYYSWDGVSEVGAHVMVYPDYEYQAQLLGELTSFYDCITNRILPLVVKSDIMSIVGLIENRLKVLEETITVLRILSSGVVPEDKLTTKKGKLINVR